MSDSEALTRAAGVVNRGGVALIPTDTVYGLAAHPGFPDAVRRISAIKSRPDDKPIALLAASIGAVREFGAVPPPAALRLAAKHWPGALTLVVPCGDGYEGFRVPDHAFTQELLRMCGGVLRVSSANISGRAPAKDAATVLKELGVPVDIMIDGGVLSGGVPSTVVRVYEDDTLQILRHGAIDAESLTGR